MPVTEPVFPITLFSLLVSPADHQQTTALDATELWSVKKTSNILLHCTETYNTSVLVFQFSLSMSMPRLFVYSITSASCHRVDTRHVAILFLLRSTSISLVSAQQDFSRIFETIYLLMHVPNVLHNHKICALSSLLNAITLTPVSW